MDNFEKEIIYCESEFFENLGFKMKEKSSKHVIPKPKILQNANKIHISAYYDKLFSFFIEKDSD